MRGQKNVLMYCRVKEFNPKHLDLCYQSTRSNYMKPRCGAQLLIDGWRLNRPTYIKSLVTFA